MGGIKLEPRCPNNINGITLDPEPNWTLNDLISELNSLELKLNGSSTAPIFTKNQQREFSNTKGLDWSPKPFVMRISDDEADDTESDEEIKDSSFVAGKRFCCDELYVSDSDTSEDALTLEEPEAYLMEPVGSLQGFFLEREYEHQQGTKEDIRNKISLLERDVLNENEKSSSAFTQVEKYTEARREMDKRLDTQYRRKTVEALENHLITVQRDHEQRSQIEERRIRNDAAFEEAKRKERAHQEEMVRQEKAKAEREAAKKRVEEAKKAALEAERIAKEDAEKKATETANKAYVEASQKMAMGGAKDGNAEARKGGNMVKAAESALQLEAARLQKHKELDEKNRALKLGSNQDFRRYELQIGRHVRQIAGTIENVRAKVNELIKIMNDPQCPHSISIAEFAKKVVSQCETSSANFDSTAFACGHVIVLVTSQVPVAMDLLLAEFHRACIYTVPKHVVHLESKFSKDYLKMLGYREEEDGKMETTDHYLERVGAYMKLYGALVQTEVDGVQNVHGLKEGWAWLARLLNALPININTAVALEAFLKMAGFALHRRYKSQFKKILVQISRNFVTALEARKDPKLNPVIIKIKTYIDISQFLKEPEGWRLQTSLLSGMIIPESESGYRPNHNQYYHHQPRSFNF